MRRGHIHISLRSQVKQQNVVTRMKLIMRFLVACTRLYKSPCRSVRPSVRNTLAFASSFRITAPAQPHATDIVVTTGCIYGTPTVPAHPSTTTPAQLNASSFCITAPAQKNGMDVVMYTATPLPFPLQNFFPNVIDWPHNMIPHLHASFEHQNCLSSRIFNQI